MMKAQVVTIVFLLVSACGTPAPSNSATNGEPDAGPNNGTDTGNNTSNGTTPPVNSGQACAEIGPRFIDAVRALPRTCTINADCRIVERAQVCDCDLAVSRSSETAEYDAIRAELDTAQCANPFGCAVDKCPYRRLSEPGEVFAFCTDEGECETVQVLACSEFEARSRGGIVPPGGCTDASQCTIRADLNPCGCGESISSNFPFLTVQAVAEMMEINNTRCALSCAPCDPPGTATCGPDGAGNMICKSE